MVWIFIIADTALLFFFLLFSLFFSSISSVGIERKRDEGHDVHDSMGSEDGVFFGDQSDACFHSWVLSRCLLYLGKKKTQRDGR